MQNSALNCWITRAQAKTLPVNFTCFDPADGIDKNCWKPWPAQYPGKFRCFDPTNDKYERPNYLEKDHTPNQSPLTSIQTDHIYMTSASVDVMEAQFSHESTPISDVSSHCSQSLEKPEISERVSVSTYTSASYEYSSYEKFDSPKKSDKGQGTHLYPAVKIEEEKNCSAIDRSDLRSKFTCFDSALGVSRSCMPRRCVGCYSCSNPVTGKAETFWIKSEDPFVETPRSIIQYHTSSGK